MMVIIAAITIGTILFFTLTDDISISKLTNVINLPITPLPEVLSPYQGNINFCYEKSATDIYREIGQYGSTTLPSCDVSVTTPNGQSWSFIISPFNIQTLATSHFGQQTPYITPHLIKVVNNQPNSDATTIFNYYSSNDPTQKNLNPINCYITALNGTTVQPTLSFLDVVAQATGQHSTACPAQLGYSSTPPISTKVVNRVVGQAELNFKILAINANSTVTGNLTVSYPVAMLQPYTIVLKKGDQVGTSCLGSIAIITNIQTTSVEFTEVTTQGGPCPI